MILLFTSGQKYIDIKYDSYPTLFFCSLILKKLPLTFYWVTIFKWRTTDFL